MVIWLIGMSGAGKTTIGKELWLKIKERDKKTVFLDGDLLRDVWGDKLNHSIEDRYKNAHRISNLCKLLDSQGINVIACVLSIFPEWQEWNRNNFSNYFEVLVKTPLEILKKIDDKGIYAKALRGEIKNVVGVDIPFPTPKNPDVVIDNSSREKNPKKIAKDLFRIIEKDKGYLF